MFDPDAKAGSYKRARATGVLSNIRLRLKFIVWVLGFLSCGIMYLFEVVEATRESASLLRIFSNLLLITGGPIPHVDSGSKFHNGFFVKLAVFWRDVIFKGSEGCGAFGRVVVKGRGRAFAIHPLSQWMHIAEMSPVTIGAAEGLGGIAMAADVGLVLGHLVIVEESLGGKGAMAETTAGPLGHRDRAVMAADDVLNQGVVLADFVATMGARAGDVLVQEMPDEEGVVAEIAGAGQALGGVLMLGPDVILDVLAANENRGAMLAGLSRVVSLDVLDKLDGAGGLALANATKRSLIAKNAAGGRIGYVGLAWIKDGSGGLSVGKGWIWRIRWELEWKAEN